MQTEYHAHRDGEPALAAAMDRSLQPSADGCARWSDARHRTVQRRPSCRPPDRNRSAGCRTKPSTRATLSSLSSYQSGPSLYRVRTE